MGPTLYNSDPNNRNVVNRMGEICGDDEECYFLHSDMLHESPACIGIAHDPETTSAYGNVYWAFDTTGNQLDGQLVRFDFSQPHGPGSMDHSVAAIRRFPQVTLSRGDPGVHAGLVVHPTTRELFIAEPGANQVVMFNVDSGSFARTAREEYPIYSNALPSFEYSIYECPDQRVFASGIDTPTGLAISPDGERLFVAERGSGEILVYEIATGSLLTRLETSLNMLGGLSFSPESKKLHFVDEETNSLYAVNIEETCANPFQSRFSSSFNQSVSEAIDSIGQDVFSLYRDYDCVVDPVVPDAAFFEQVHTDTGYASDDPNVQADMTGMDPTAALLENRTDCGYTSELNFDALLLGGYFCHQCLPGNYGAECDIGGTCTNVQWNGFTCDNEFIVVLNSLGQVEIRKPNNTVIDPTEILLRKGVTYRFTIRGDLLACAADGAISIGCATRGPLFVSVTDETSYKVYLQIEDTTLELNVFNDFGTGIYCFSGNTLVQVAEKGETMMRDVRVGDRVLTEGGVYETVYSFGHRDEKLPAKYLKILPSSLEVSQDHMVFVDQKGAIPASLIEVGDKLIDFHGGTILVEEIHEIERVGAYSPFTHSGTLFVNGILSSSYISFQNSSVLKIGVIETPFTYQWLAHAFMAPNRIWLRLIGYNQNGPMNSKWAKIGFNLYDLLLRKTSWWMGIMLFPILASLILFVSIETVINNVSAIIFMCLVFSLSRCFKKKN